MSGDGVGGQGRDQLLKSSENQLAKSKIKLEATEFRPRPTKLEEPDSKPDIKPFARRTHGMPPISANEQKLRDFKRNLTLPLCARTIETINYGFVPGTNKKRAAAICFGSVESILGPPNIVPPSEVVKARKLRKMQEEQEGVTAPSAKTSLDEPGDWDWDADKEETKNNEQKHQIPTSSSGQSNAPSAPSASAAFAPLTKQEPGIDHPNEHGKTSSSGTADHSNPSSKMKVSREKALEASERLLLDSAGTQFTNPEREKMLRMFQELARANENNCSPSPSPSRRPPSPSLLADMDVNYNWEYSDPVTASTEQAQVSQPPPTISPSKIKLEKTDSAPPLATQPMISPSKVKSEKIDSPNPAHQPIISPSKIEREKNNDPTMATTVDDIIWPSVAVKKEPVELIIKQEVEQNMEVVIMYDFDPDPAESPVNHSAA